MSDPYGIGSPTKPPWTEEGMYLPRTETSNPQQLFPTSQDSVSDKASSEAVAESQGSSSHMPSFGDYQSYSHAYEQNSARFRTRTSPSAPSIMSDNTAYRASPASEHIWRSRLDARGGMGMTGHHSGEASGSSSTHAPLGPILLGDAEEFSDDGEVGEGESGGYQQSPAEKLAARRKMKRFRLTHQQTRFLMSEFAKQPHPDAAHRDRLSREIPGLSPRQVQVWFQNRRAKIKRLNADDRERVVQMRAVPENFDNVQALHSPYGAVQAYDGSISHAPSHSQHHMYGSNQPRPLLVDVRRTESEAPMQTTGLTPIFGGIGFGQGHVPGMLETNPIVPSPSGFGSAGRYTYGPRPPGGAGDNKSPSTGSPVHEGDHRAGPRPLQPPGLPDSLARGRSSSMQSTMGSSMYWRGSGLGDVAEAQDPTSEHGSEGQPPPLHSSGSGMGLNTLFYGGDTATQGSSSTSEMASIHHDQLRRNRAASASFPLDGRSQYSDMGQPPTLSPIRTETARPPASGHTGPTYAPGYATSPFPGSMAREQVPQFAYNSGETSATTVGAFPMPSPAAAEAGDQRPFFHDPASVNFERQEGMPYGESTETDASKQE